MSLAPRYFYRIWTVLDYKLKRKILITICGMIITAILDALTILSVIPFLKAIIDPDFSKLIFSNYLFFLPFLDKYNPTIFITFIFLFFIVFSSISRTFILWRTALISSFIGSYLSKEVFSIVLYQDYENYTNMDSSEFITVSTNYVDVTLQILNSTFTILISVILITGLCLVLFITKPIVTFGLIFLILTTYLLIVKISKKRLNFYSDKIALETRIQIKTLQKSFGAFKDIKLSNSENLFINNYKNIDLNLRLKQAKVQFFSFYPRYILEAISITSFVIVAYILSKTVNNPINILPFLGALALAAQKLLPLSQNIYNSWSIIKSRETSLYFLLDFINDLKYKKENHTHNLNFNNSKKFKFNNLVVKNLSFGYKSHSNSKLILKKINFKINRGERIAFIGSTGSGKSTLLDILMGLLKPSEGQILLNDKDINNEMNSKELYVWRNSISNVPQNIYISEGSISENISLCESKEINYNKIYNAAKLAKLDKFIESLKYKYLTNLGERGIKLSGGQIQRLALARAIYKDAKVLILDEATSALDFRTENEIISAIESLPEEYTIIYVSHRMETIKNCDRIYKIEDGFLSSVDKII